jgi:4-oxalocrotonate tautomerase
LEKFKDCLYNRVLDCVITNTRRSRMPVIHVNVWEGFGQEKAKITIQNITKVFADLDIPAHAVEVIIHEVQKSHWGIGGEPASEKFKDL